MPSTIRSRVRSTLSCSHNRVVVAAVLLAMPVGYAVQATVPGGEFVGVMAVLLLGVVVPEIYDDHGPAAVDARRAVGHVLALAAVALGAYLAAHRALRTWTSPESATPLAFLLAAFGLAVTARALWR